MELIFDIETDGLLDDLSRIHCIAAIDRQAGKSYDFGPDRIQEGLDFLATADALTGHNILRFDLPAIRMLHPSWGWDGLATDTMVLSKVIWADLRERDARARSQNPELPAKDTGSHALGAWGRRLGVTKDDYEGGFDEWNQEMHDYCIQDVVVTSALYDLILKRGLDERCWNLEHKVAEICFRQERYGFSFDTHAAADLYGRLSSRRDELARDLAGLFPDWEVRTPFTPKVNNQKLGYEKGVPTYKTKVIEFNPNSRDHIALKLTEKYGWKPVDFTTNGKPRVDEVVLSKLKYPEAKLLAENFLLTKRIGQLSEGRYGWMNLVKPDGRIHGGVNTNGAVTGRMTHAYPNMAQVPSTRAIYGKECRDLFYAADGYKLVGCDADALELRCLASYMAFWDGGAYTDVVLHGNKAEGTDTHTRNASALGCDRDTAKTWFYAFIYGAGDRKLGSILGGNSKRGAESKASFFKALPALGELVAAVRAKAEDRGRLIGLDGRPLYVRSAHAALNTLLQSAGAVIMKQALVILDEDLKDVPAHFVANVHDEWQLEVKEGHEDDVGRRAVDAIRRAGEMLGCQCPMDAQYVVGRTWADTH